MIALSILYERNSVGIIYEESRGGLRVSRLSTHPQQGSALFIALLPRARSVWLHAHSHTAEIPSDWPLGLWSLLALQPPCSCFICISVFLFVPCLSTPPYLFDFTLVASWDVFDLCSSFSFFFFFPSFFDLSEFHNVRTRNVVFEYMYVAWCSWICSGKSYTIARDRKSVV